MELIEVERAVGAGVNAMPDPRIEEMGGGGGDGGEDEAAGCAGEEASG